MKVLTEFYDIVTNPYSYARKWKTESGGKILATFCSYAPEEIIYASGALPFRIFGTSENITLADSHLQSYCCSLVRGSLEEALAGRLNFLDGTVFPHTCDSIQRLSDIWRINAGFPLHFDVILPVKLNTPNAGEYFQDVLKKFLKDIETALHIEIDNDKLIEAVKLYNNIREKTGAIYRLKSDYPEIISGRDLHTVIKAGMLMDRKDYLLKLDDLLELLDDKKENSQKSSKKRIMLAGGICNHPDIYTLLEDSGAAVIWDDLCTGTRFTEGIIEEKADPLAAITKRYLDRAVCPAKHSGLFVRGERLVKLAKEHNAAGVIFLFLKFCDPHCFDYPYLKSYLDKEGIRNMLLEIEEQPQSEGQLKTRFETFIDML